MLNNNCNKSNRKLSVFEKIVLVVLFLLCLFASVFYFIRFRGYDISNNPLDFGPFGDYIGGILGTLVGLIGIVFLYRTYNNQLSFSEVQEEIQKYQQFESTFFSLLSEQRDIKQKMEGTIVKGPGRPKRLFANEYWTELRKDLAMRLLDLLYEPDEISIERTNSLKIKVNYIYMEFFQGHVSQLGHYFRHLYHLLKYIDDSSISLAKKKSCADIVQAQMSTDELYICAVNGISNYGRGKMLPLMDKYSFLENLMIDDDKCVSTLIHVFYPSTKQKSVDSNKKNIIFLGGIHGSGKSYFADKIIEQILRLEKLSCSEILQWKDPKQKEVEDVINNQDRLVINLPNLIDIDKTYLLDGHFCLLNTKGERERVPLYVFQAIDPALIILMDESPEVVCQRLKKRDKKEYDLQTIELLYEDELNCAQDIAAYLDIPLIRVNSSNKDEAKKAIKDFVSAFYE